MSDTRGVVIIGGGLAGATAAAELRDAGYAGPVSLLAAEAHAPYDRPPLSKAVLTREKSVNECALYAEAFFGERDIDLRLATHAALVDRNRQEVVLESGDRIGYDRLLLATGAAARELGVLGARLPGVFTLRTADDACALRERFHAGQRIAIIGGGFIGLEVAASAVAAGCDVTVVEAGVRLLARAVPSLIAERMEARHLKAGVRFRFGEQIRAISGTTKAEAVELADGELIECDTVVVGIGAAPRTSLALSSGLDVGDGIIVDEHLRTSDPRIFAAGDACVFPHALYGRSIRLECWMNAKEQGRVAARNILGESLVYRQVPWFWSDQYELSIQIAGLPTLAERTVSRETDDTLLLFHLSADDVLVGASGVGRAVGRDIRIAQMLIERRACVSPSDLGDSSVNLKKILTKTAEVAAAP